LIGGGEANTVLGDYASIGGGNGNLVLSNYGSILVRFVAVFVTGVPVLKSGD